MFKLVLIALLSHITIDIGHAAYYNPGIMEQVVAIRRAGWTANPLPPELPHVIGFVARRDCSEIGQLVWMCHESEGCRGPYLVSDCANQLEGHDKMMEKMGIVVEIDYNTAARWQVLGYGPRDIDVMVISVKSNID